MARTGAVKIGRSSDPERRLKELQTSCPHELRIILVLNDQGHLEKSLHKALHEYRTIRGNQEWFREAGLPSLPPWIYDLFDLDMINTWWERPPELPGP